jgi:hypothetical protein
MTEEQFHALFRTVADHLESLAISIQSAKELQARDRARQEQDRGQQKNDLLRMDRRERLLKWMIRRGDRERQDWRARINALIDMQMRKAAEWEASWQNLKAKRNELIDTRLRGEITYAAIQQKADERMLRIEDANAQFQAQVGQALRQLAAATALAHRRLDALESNP